MNTDPGRANGNANWNYPFVPGENKHISLRVLQVKILTPGDATLDI